MKGRYKWDNLFCNKVFTLYKGRDYECSQSSMVSQIRTAASNRGLSVSVHDGSDCVEVLISGPQPVGEPNAPN